MVKPVAPKPELPGEVGLVGRYVDQICEMPGQFSRTVDTNRGKCKVSPDRVVRLS